MPVAAWAIPAVIGAGVSLYGTHKQASAAKDAAGQQVDAANQAKAELRPIHEQNIARMQPYANIGNQALGSLGSLMGYQGGGAPMAPGAAPSGPASPLSPQQIQAGQMMGQGIGRVFNGSPVGTAVPRTASSYGSLASLGAGATGGSMPTGGGGMIRMMAPDGEMREIPAALEQQATQAGARRVN
jgi:hypothetical protein